MAFLLSYIKKGEGCYPDFNYPGLTAYNCDWEHSLHLAISEDGCVYAPLRNNTGVLFAKASFEEDEFKGVTRTLIDPWVFRAKDGSFKVCAVLRGQNAPDEKRAGCMVVFDSTDMVHYSEPVWIRLSEDEEIRRPRCRYDSEKEQYYAEWETGSGLFCGYSKDLRGAHMEKTSVCLGKKQCAPGEDSGGETVNEPGREENCSIKNPAAFQNFGIKDCVPGNVIEITEQEKQTLCRYFGEIHYVRTEPVHLTWPVGKSLEGSLPGALCVYSDGSTHEKRVSWDKEKLSAVDTAKPGEWEIPGKILQKRWKFPMPLRFLSDEPPEFRGMSDPCVTEYHGKYYLSSSGNDHIQLRVSNTIEGTFSAEPVVIFRVPLENGIHFAGTWAAELHEIDGRLYLFTALCANGDWTHVKACVLCCDGEPDDPASWKSMHMCVKADGSDLTQSGISLDMTYFRDNGIDYVMWSDRKMRYKKNSCEAGTADIFIGTIDAKTPWQLTSEPRCILRPMYGWDRYETTVDEGPYLLRHGDDLFVTVSGSSTGMADLYDVGLLRATSGTDLLNPENWSWLPYPLLTKESVPGEYGPGHNNFVKDPDTGDDLMIYHAVPHDKYDRTLQRQPGIRRVHWAYTGLPYLEMTPERDLPEGKEEITMRLTVE